MSYKKTAKLIGFGIMAAFALSFLFSYKFLKGGDLDFKAVTDVKAFFAGKDKPVKAENLDEKTKPEKVEEKLVYDRLSGYRDQNPYRTLLVDRDIIRDMRNCVGTEVYTYLLKSIPNANKVYYDPDSDTYTVKGDFSEFNNMFSGIIQLKPNGKMYIAFLDGAKIGYYTNDKEFGDKVVDNVYMNEWIENNKSGREIVYMNR